MNAAKRRFVHVFATFGAGGPQLRAAQLFGRMGPGHHHVVMAMDGCTAAAAMLPADVACEFVPPPRHHRFLAMVQTQVKWLREQQPDLVLTYNWGAIETAAAARRLGLPRVHHEDGFLPDEAAGPLRRRSWMRMLVLRSTPVIVPSLVLARIARTDWHLRADRVHHLPNGVDLQRFRPASRDAATPVIGTVGGLRAEKDHGTLLQAVSRLSRPRVCIVGGGVLADSLRARSAGLGLAGTVEFAGPVADTAPWYAGFGIFVLSSCTEQMPLALLEAMACGLPVVATDVGDVREVLPPEQGELVVPAADPAALAAALQRLLADAPLRARLGAANRRRVEAKYEAGSCLDRFVQVYAQSLGAR